MFRRVRDIQDHTKIMKRIRAWDTKYICKEEIQKYIWSRDNQIRFAEKKDD